MIKLALLSLLLVTSITLRTHDTHNLQATHLINQASCLKKGGVLCGRINKDCCQLGCETKFFVHESCQDGKFLTVSDEKPAQNSSSSGKKPADVPQTKPDSKAPAADTKTPAANTKTPAASKTPTYTKAPASDQKAEQTTGTTKPQEKSKPDSGSASNSTKKEK